MFKKTMMLVSLSVLPAVASAHAGHAESGLWAGFIHPFTGLDHLLMMLFIGVWAGQGDGDWYWRLPATFLFGMSGGWILGLAGVVMPGLETGIAATLIALGAILALQVQMPRLVQLGCVALFAVLHGLAHGGELTGGAAGTTATGMLAATALLHTAGLGATRLIPAANSMVYRVAGTVLAVFGGGLLAAL